MVAASRVSWPLAAAPSGLGSLEAIPSTGRTRHGWRSWLARGRTFAQGPSVCRTTTAPSPVSGSPGAASFGAVGGGVMMAGVKRGQDEAEFYREIVRRAKRVRERAAESLRLSRLSRKKQGNVGRPPDTPPRSRHGD
jgi:hypothetical protein